MTTIAKVGIGVAAVAVAVAVVPALKGPYNRAKLVINEKLNDEFVVDNYKAEYVNLSEKRGQVLESIQKFEVEMKVAERKLENANANLNTAKQKLIEGGTSNLAEFNKMKDCYERFKVEVANLELMVNTYSNGQAKLKKTLMIIDSNMAKTKLNVDTLTAKKNLVDAIKGVNSTLANIKGVGDTTLAVSVEKLDDDMLRENIKLETLEKTDVVPATTTKEAAQAYIDSVKLQGK